MRKSRSLTRAERWDLGLLLVLLMAGFLCLAVVWQTGAASRLYAFAFQRDVPAAEPVAAADAALAPVVAAPPVRQVMPARAMQFEGPPAVAPQVPAPVPPVVRPAETKKAEPKKPADVRYYNGEAYRYVKTIRMRVTAYAPDSRCCWPYPGTTTASGLSVRTNRGKLVAADTRVIPFHSLVSIPGYHAAEGVPVLDRGGAIKGNRIDVLMPSYAQAKAWGSRLVDVKVYRPVDDD